MPHKTNSKSVKHKISEPDWESMKNHWPSSIVSRSKIGDFTGGVLSPGRMANLDCAGEGPPTFYGVNNKVFYETQSLIEWMKIRYIENWNKRRYGPAKLRKLTKS